MFAKLHETTFGQCLVQKTEQDEPFHYCLEIKLNIQPPFKGVDAVITKTIKFGDTDESEMKRDKAFDEWTETNSQTEADKGVN